MRFVIFSKRGLRGKRWYFRGLADNGEPVLQSEGYHNHGDAAAMVRSIRKWAAGATVDDSEHEAALLKYNFLEGVE